MAENCCRECKTVMQLCQNYRCLCHLIRDHKKTGGITYPDPVGNTAAGNADRQRRYQPKRHRQNR